jgi:hypothetical protein
MNSIVCRICSSASTHLFKGEVLNSHQIDYFRCSQCGFIQTEEPYWLEEAYSSAIASIDVGLVQRNVTYAPLVEVILSRYFDADARFLDYGGGYGLFVRLMRDRGYDFRLFDEYCENVFAANFELANCENKLGFEIVTAFEVFEHLVMPMAEIGKMLEHSESLLFSTELSDGKNIPKWWYLAPDSGQHISFYSRQTLEYIAAHFGLKLYSILGDLHLLTPRSLPDNIFRIKPTVVQRKLKPFAKWINRIVNSNEPKPRKSLIQPDVDRVRNQTKSAVNVEPAGKD